MADEGCVKARKDKLTMMLNHRPVVHENVVVVSSIGEQVHDYADGCVTFFLVLEYSLVNSISLHMLFAVGYWSLLNAC